MTTVPSSYIARTHERFQDVQLPTDYQRFIHTTKYARWDYEYERRETWRETVGRYCLFFEDMYPGVFPTQRVYDMISSTAVMPSMRCMMTAGPALARDNAAAFNCSFTAIYDPIKFDEIMYLLSCGCGVGFSVEKQHISKLPIIPKNLYHLDPKYHKIVVEDSKDGWQKAYRELITGLYNGHVLSWDVSGVRPAGAPLRTFGGRASGPEPLVELFKFAVCLFKKAAGRQLTALECHDLVCKTAQAIVSGGVRRSALISISDLDDGEIRDCKIGHWEDKDSWHYTDPHRRIANNTAVFDEKPSKQEFDKCWEVLVKSGSGERGIFNRAGAVKKIRELGKRNTDLWQYMFGLNPCGEIVLRPDGFCNLTEVVARPGDSLQTLLDKAEMAAILGTFQATLSNFKNLSQSWKTNQEEERLLGVSITGILDHEVLRTCSVESAFWLKCMREKVNETNYKWSAILGITPATASTCVKPSGTVSLLVNSSSGSHARHNQYYIRNMQLDRTSSISQFLMKYGYPVRDSIYTDKDICIGFPIKGPENSVYRNDRTAFEQLEHYLHLKKNWCEHNPSTTIYVEENEWDAVGQWVYNNFDDIGGISFFPKESDMSAYGDQLPFMDCTEEQYLEISSKFPNIDWVNLSEFEKSDMTEAAQELACAGGVCMLQ